MKVFLNQQLHGKEELNEILEPGYLFGWGAFETMRAVRGRIPCFTEHRRRLETAITILHIGPVDVEWEKEVGRLLEINNLTGGDAYVRITVYKKRKGSGVIIYVDRFGYYPPAVYETGFKAVMSPYLRYEPEEFRAVKSLSYGMNRLSWLHAQKNKKDEALVTNTRGRIVGGARSNLFLVRQGTLCVPRPEGGVFDGLTARSVRRVAAAIGLAIEEQEIDREAVWACEEAFLTSSLLYVMPLVEFEGRHIAEGIPGEITRRLLDRYREDVHG